MSPNGPTYSVKRIRTDSCGTPKVHGGQIERCWLSFLFDKYDSIPSNVAPAIPKSYRRRRSSMEGFMVSNASHISRAMIAVIFFTQLQCTYIQTHEAVGSQLSDRHVRYADWKELKFPEA